MDTPEEQGETFLKADEIDEVDVPVEFELFSEPSQDNQNDEQESWNLSSPREDNASAVPATGQDMASGPRRPPLNRESSVPAPQQPPPPPPQQQQLDDQGYPTDSLSLAQLRKLVTDMPKAEPAPYAFTYQDAAPFAEEIEEWFEYNTEERAMLLKAQSSFAQRWQAFNESAGLGEYAYVEGKLDWRSATDGSQPKFLREIGNALADLECASTTANLMCLTYLCLGLWNETAGLVDEAFMSRDPNKQGAQGDVFNIGPKHEKSSLQIHTMQDGAFLLHDYVSIQTIFNILRKVFEREWDLGEPERINSDERAGPSKDDIQSRRWCCLTIMYTYLEASLHQPILDRSPLLRKSINALEPNLLSYLSALIARLRWEDPYSLPLSKILLLYWKTMLVVFGGTDQIEQIKKDLARAYPQDPERTELITASPLDYHFFRQEITSKYPAFNPPPPLFAFEPDISSILPPLQSAGNRNGFSLRQDQRIGPAGPDGIGTSILHQPVHIATPAPSPPPSPAGPGGKLGKKQNYQTNQMFPFLYPPLVPSSNDLGGKGTTELQDLLVGRRWEGSDIPASILEATDLFAHRMRATRAMRQLWEERIRYMKYERGYNGIGSSNGNDEEDDAGQKASATKLIDERAALDEAAYQRLDAVEDFYKHVLPDLQSIVIVLLKVLLTTVTNIVTQGAPQDGLATGFQSPEPSNPNGVGQTEVNGVNNTPEKKSDTILRGLDTIRSQEISGKAVSAIIFLLLKWFKVSHILKFEYLSQLLLDSNYIQLILKLFTHQELERAVVYKCERKYLNFFRFCQTHSRRGADLPSSGNSEASSDDAAPPPIKLHREDDISVSKPPEGTAEDYPSDAAPLPTVDELGHPSVDMPAEPITDFSWRNFFSSINFLRIMQKVCKHKAHRNLLMVQYKYSNILKKSLKVPQPDIRLYTLKIIKGQVPYCNRKWRAANMRTITAIYLHCRPELRDDWLAGIDVDAEMMEALPQEQAIRALTYWYNIKRYPDRMGVEQDVLEKEQDFFLKELDALGSEAGSVDLDGEDEDGRFPAEWQMEF